MTPLDAANAQSLHTPPMVPKGYKQTEVGVIPEGWEVATGEQITALIAKGASPRWQGYEYGDIGMLFITSENVRNGYLDIRQPKFLPFAFHEKLKRSKVKHGDVLINLVGGSIGRSCQVRQELGEANVNQAVAVFRVGGGNNASFIASYLQAPLTIDRILDMQVDAARPNISLGGLRRFPFPLPSFSEQEAIAEALGDADALIDSLEQLIAKKRAIKQGAMQELLIGKTRLPGFEVRPGYKQTEIGEMPNDWNPKQISDVCRLVNGRGFKPHEWQTTGLPIIRIQNLNGSQEFNYFQGPYDKKLEVENGQLLFAWSGSRGTSFGPHIWRGTLGLLNYHTWKVVVNDDVVNSEFFLHALRQLTKFIEDRAHGASALVHTQKWEMEGFHFPIPPTEEEQAAIAAVCSDMDDEITALDAKFTKALAIKQGMMQELLTGRVRLV